MTTLVDAPTRVDGVELIGEMVGSGYRTPPALVRRSDGQVLQLTPLLYLVLQAADGRRTYAEIADRVSHSMQRLVSEGQVRSLVDGHLRQLGLVSRRDGLEPEVRRSNPLLALKLRYVVTDPERTRRLTDPFQVLFRPLVAWVVCTAFLAVLFWLFFRHGLAASAFDAFQRPHLLLLVFVLSLLSGGFHEFGHAAAARYGGAQPGVMGAGLYIVWPAFYTDVTDSYRLSRVGRIRADLGGLYFNAVVVVLTFLCWWATGMEALLLVVATQILQMVHQLLPLLRFDGYHLLADLAGVPDLYHRIKPTLVGLLPHRWNDPQNRLLKPWARALITLWVLVTVPMLIAMLLITLTTVPRIVGSAGGAVRANAQAVATSWHEVAPVDVAAHTLELFAVILPVVASALILSRIGVRFFRGLALWGRGSIARRFTATGVSVLVVTALLWAWWPNPGTYRPIQQGERGLLTSILPGTTPAAAHPAVGEPVGRSAALPQDSRLPQDQPLTATFAQDRALPTRSHPSLAMVLLPAEPGSHPGAQPGDQPTAPPAEAPPATGEEGVWVFPFDRPLPPDEGDNQALAVNTTDGSTVYDLAFALVWVDGDPDDQVGNVNEAHAYASCTDCVTVAVAFQVVLVMNDAHVVVPQNLAVAANYKCFTCITAAIANQLVLSVDGAPDEAQQKALAALWTQLTQFAHTITSYSISAVAAQLEAFKDQVKEILGVPQAPSSPQGEATAVSSGAASPDASEASGSPSPDPETTGMTGTTGTTDPSPVPDATTSDSSPAPASDPSTSTGSPTDATSPAGTDAGASDTTSPAGTDGSASATSADGAATP